MQKNSGRQIHNNLSQEALGKLFQTSKQAVCSWEKGRNQPSIIKFMQLLELDGANVQDSSASAT